MKNYSILTFVILLLFASCSKDNTSAKKLDGVWNMSSVKINNNELISANTRMETTFTGISQNTGRYNTKVFILNVLSNEAKGDFNISGDGTKITLDEDGASTPGTGSILELTNTYIHVSYTDKDDNLVVFKGDKQ